VTSLNENLDVSSPELEIVVVSGLPRSGTSLMMRMLALGGLELLIDGVRAPDADNPYGYFEYERVKALGRDSSWMGEARGKGVKVVSRLLYDLPRTETYRVMFMERDLEEVLVSQEKMLARRGGKSAPRDRIRVAFRSHLERLAHWLDEQPNISRLVVCYNTLLADPATQAAKVASFLGGRVDSNRMTAAIDPTLYRSGPAKRTSP